MSHFYTEGDNQDYEIASSYQDAVSSLLYPPLSPGD